MPRITGRYERTRAGGEEVAAFIPEPLPPRDPPLALGGELAPLLSRAEAALGRLDLASAMVPSVGWLLYSFVRKEAVVSSQIEGTQATLMDLFAFEAAGKADSMETRDVREVCNYLDAVAYARRQLESPKGLPLSARLLGETHRRLMRGVRGTEKSPGQIRRSQNWIGGTRPGNAAYVPPPPHAVGGLLSGLERFLHGESDLPALVRAGLCHAQFETIHPYLDGNGRIGRLLIALLLEHWKLLREPLLYLSLFFKQHRAEYYRRLDGVRRQGDFEGWLAFFFEGTAVVAEEAVTAIRDLFALVTTDRARVLSAETTSVMAVRLFELLPEHPIVTIGRAVELLGTTKPTANKAVSALVNAGVLVETTGRRRDRAFGYAAYLDRLRAGMEVPDSGMAATSPVHGRRPPTAEPSDRKRRQPFAEEPPRA
ncbi:MAG: Fic family protein [Planctomycetes bacterium]|jgi:Fic family protein|nr:Fic family protein [Planctomycetota bacterium]